MSHLVSFCWIRITQYIPELGLYYKEGGKLWKVVRRNNRSGSNIFNRCSVQIPLLPSKKVPFFKRASWASSLIYALFYEGALFIKGILGNMIMIGIGQ